jgi:hypothetical protein
MPTFLELINKSASNWTWREINKGDELYLGSCFDIIHHIKTYIIKHDKTVADVIHSWNTEPLIVECRAAMHIFYAICYYSKYGPEISEKNRNVFMFSELPVKTNPMVSLPFNGDFTKVKEGNISDSIFIATTGIKPFDMMYIQGSRVNDLRVQKYPLLDSAFQGENTCCASTSKNTYIGFFRDLKKNSGNIQYIEKTRTEIENDLVENCKKDFALKYPDITETEGYFDIVNRPPGIVTMISYDQHYHEVGDMYQPIEDTKQSSVDTL